MLFLALLFSAVFLLRLCHAGLLWPDEDYHLAAAIQLLHGKLFYRDFWYDKPPLSAVVYALAGAPIGWPLRLFDAVYVTGICSAAYELARVWWGTKEGRWAAGAMAFFLCFDFPSAVIPIAPDFFMILPHILAILCMALRKPFAAGIFCAVAFLFNTKAIFVLAACAVFLPTGVLPLLGGFMIPNVFALALLAWGGAAQNYLQQVWTWGAAYARNPPSNSSRLEMFRRLFDWSGFHVVLILGAAWYWRAERTLLRSQLILWTVISLAAIVIGPQLPPRYFLQLLPVFAIAGARGLSLIGARRLLIAAVVLMALVPVIRFGPRYATLAHFADTVLDRDSREVADRIPARPGDTLFIWGYRPDVFAFARLDTASRFWDSQPLTGVPADRHLFDNRPIIGSEWAARNRAELISSKPTWIVDSLSVLNPKLSIDGYPELAKWMEQYEMLEGTKLTRIYRRRELSGAR